MKVVKNSPIFELWAYWFAAFAHWSVGQKRKYTGEPYINHCKQVAGYVRAVRHDSGMIAAAYLHDTVEDTWVKLWMIRILFGKDVATLVWWLTDISTPTMGNRETRKTIDRHHLSKAPARAQTIKVADNLSNSADITANDPGFAKVYLREKAKLMEVLLHADLYLYKLAMAWIPDNYMTPKNIEIMTAIKDSKHGDITSLLGRYHKTAVRS